MNRTEQRKTRMNVRHAVGTSSDPPPDLEQILRALTNLDGLLNANSGRFYLQLGDRRTGQTLTAAEALNLEVAARRADRNARLNALHTGTYKAGE